MVPNHPLVKLPPTIDLALYLIREELKIQRFFNGLDKVGLGECFYQPQLSKVILATLGMDDGNEETLEFYCRVIEKRSRKIEGNNESVMKQAVKVYVELMGRKKEGASNGA